jgi:ClpP class serine protease
MIADSVASVWNTSAQAMGHAWPSYAIAAACLLVSAILLGVAVLRRAPHPHIPAPVDRRRERTERVEHRVEQRLEQLVERRAERRKKTPGQPTVLVQTAFTDDDQAYQTYQDEFVPEREPELYQPTPLWADRPAPRSRGLPAPAAKLPAPADWSGPPMPARPRAKGLTADEAFATHARGVSDPRAYWPVPQPAPLPEPPRSRSLIPMRKRSGEVMPKFDMRDIPSTLEAAALTMTGSTREILARLEARRGSRVIAIVHRENSKRNWLDVVDLEDALTAIRKAPKNRPLDIILHSAGGLIRASQQIARAIHAHPARTTVFVPYYALGSVTFIAFAADEIVMSAHAALSPVDPFVGAGPASSVLAGIKDKPVERIEDETIISADIAKKMLDEARRLSCELMHDGRDHGGACRMADELVSGKWSRDRAITAAIAKELGLNVSTSMPNDVYELVRSCRRGVEHDTSVAYLDEHDRAEPRGQSYRERARHAGPVGVLDSGVAAIVEREKAPATSSFFARSQPAHSVWLAHSGGHVPAATAERAEALIRRIEEVRGSRVICVIHGENMEHEQFNFTDLEDVLSALVASDSNRPLDIVLHTQGGNSFAGRQIARAIKAHRARKTVFVPYFAMSAGTRVALSADHIVMGAHATLGPIDTQLFGLPSPSILQLLTIKPIEAIKDEFLILAQEARKIMAEGRATACELLQGTYSDDGSCAIADEMIGGKWSHGFPIMAKAAKELGLNVSTDLPDIFYDLVRCFRHADGEDPSVLFIPR